MTDENKKVEQIHVGDGDQGGYEEHYVCSGGCGFVAKRPRKCNRPGCPRNRNPLTLCECTDGKHERVKHLNDPEYKAEEKAGKSGEVGRVGDEEVGMGVEQEKDEESKAN